MSENIDTELSEIEGKIVTLSNAVQFAGNTFVDLAQKLAAAIAGGKQIGLTDAQLAEFSNIKSELDGAASELTLAATTADPAPVSPPPSGDDTVAAPAGDDSVSAPAGDDSVSGPSGDDTTAA